MAGGEGDEKNKQNSHTKHKVRIKGYKRWFSENMGIMKNRKKVKKISLVCISFRRVQGREMKK